jgi:hypothetical protein
MKLGQPLFARQLRKQVAQNMLKLKAVLEQQGEQSDSKLRIQTQ